LLTSTPIWSEGKVIIKLSNPKRHSYILGTSAKTLTPQKFLLNSGKVIDFKDLKGRFSLEVVNKEFYEEISNSFSNLVGGIRTYKKKVVSYSPQLKLPINTNQHQKYLEFAVRLIGRIIFCWFLKEKKSINNRPLMPELLLSTQATKKENYYHSILEPIFFEVLNKPIKNRKEEFSLFPFSEIPYLNGGLFSPQEDDFYDYIKTKQLENYSKTIIPNTWFSSLFEVLETYNFTIDENTSFDEELSIDPEMLGRIFENLLAEINPETGDSARKNTGSYYTPRLIVDYMIDESLLKYLESKTNIQKEKLKSVITYDLEDDLEFPLNTEEKEKIINSLAEIKILDPACGSGAFPMGILQKIVFITQQIDPNGELWLNKQLENTSVELKKIILREFKEKNLDYIRKIGVIKENIYGVDIQPVATEISRLRCFLTLVVDERIDDKLENRGIEPLPNLDFKFVTANTLVPLPNIDFKQGDLFDDHKKINTLKELIKNYFSARDMDRKDIMIEFSELQTEMIQDLIEKHSYTGMAKAEITKKLTDWKPFKHRATNWFDKEWMYGITNGFDVIIGNPPYIKNTALSSDIKNIYKDIYKLLFDQWDIYIAFFEFALKNTKDTGLTTFITPNQWLTAKYGSRLRPEISDKILKLTDFRLYSDFDSASVNTFIAMYLRNKTSSPAILSVFDKSGIETTSKIEREVFIKGSDNLGRFISTDYKILETIEKKFVLKFSDLYNVGHSFSIPDFYKLSKIIFESNKDNSSNLKLINTGTLEKFGNLYGKKIFKYDGKSFLQPAVKREEFINNFPTRKIQTEPKLIISSMGGLKVDLDINGEYLGTRPTIWLTSKNNIEDIKIAYVILNSKLMNWYYNQLYSVAGMAGLKVTYKNIENTPFPTISNDIRTELIKVADSIYSFNKQELNTEFEKEVNKLNSYVYSIFLLNDDEIEIIENFNQRYEFSDDINFTAPELNDR